MAIAGIIITIGPRAVAMFPIGASEPLTLFFIVSILSDIVRVVSPRSDTLPSEFSIAATKSAVENAPLSIASLNRRPAPAPNKSIAIPIASASVSAFSISAIASCSPPVMSVTPSSANFLMAVFNPGIIFPVSRPFASMLAIRAVASVNGKPSSFNCGPNFTTMSARVVIGTPEAWDAVVNSSRNFFVFSAGSPIAIIASATDLIIGEASSPIARDTSKNAVVTLSRASPSKPISVLTSAIAAETVAASCGTDPQTSLNDWFSPSSCSPVAPVPAAIVLVASWYSWPNAAAAPAASVTPPAATATPFMADWNFVPMPLTFFSAVFVSASTVIVTVLATRFVLQFAFAHDCEQAQYPDILCQHRRRETAIPLTDTVDDFRNL